MPILQRSVLIVDDSAEDSIAFQRYLQREPDVEYTCHVASTVAEGLNACRSLRPDVILLDYSLPDDTGLAFLEALMAEHGSLAFAVVMLTGSGDEAVAVQALKLGAHDYLVKENHFQQRLTLAVAGAIDKVRLQRQLDQQRRDLEASNRQLRQALDERQSSEAQLRMALGAARMATWEWDLATNQIIWGDGLEDMLGLAKGTFGGSFNAFRQLVHPDDYAQVRERLDQALRGEAPYEIEFRMLRLDGSVRWAAARGSVIRDAQGAPIRMLGVDMDVTERKQADAELRASEERYRALVNATSDLVWRADAQGGILSISQLWHDLTGQSEEELRGWGWTNVVHPDDIEPALARWQVALAQRSNYENEFRVRTRDGSYRLFQGRGVPILGADGRIQEWIGYSSDITEHKQLEDQLRLSEAQFRAMVENSPDIISRFDRQLRHLYVSPEIVRATGRPPEAFIGKTHAELEIAPNQPNIWVDSLRKVFETGQAQNFEFTFQAPDQMRYYQSTIVPEYTADRIFETAISIVRDVSAYKQAEERLRFLASASKALTTSLDYQITLAQIARLAIPYLGDACIIDLNASVNGIDSVVVAHVDPQKEELLRQMRRQYAPKWNGTHPVAQVLRTGQPLVINHISQSLIESNVHSDGHRTAVKRLAPRSFMMVPFEARGQIIGVISLYAVEKQRRYAADDLELLEELARRAAIALDNARLYQEAQEAIREREAFLSIASHEVKNPLTTLLGRSQLLRRRLERKGESARELDDIDTVIDQGKRINRLLSELLDASRLESGQFSIQPAPLDLDELLQHVVSEIKPSAPDHTITYAGHPDRLEISGDASRLEQVFHNLVGNAIKYSPAGGTVTVEVAADNGYAHVAVRDQGLGIPAAALPHLFKRFYRVSHESAQQIAGSGIGLFVVKEIIAGHSGAVEVNSVEGVGSTFTVHLPLAAALEHGKPVGSQEPGARS